MTKLRKCRQCGERKPVADGVITPLAFFCSMAHAVEYARAKTQKAWEAQQRKRLAEQAKRQRAEKAEHRKRKADAKPLSYWHQRARKACHEYIRARDEHLPCISCGCWETPQWDAGHYRPAGVNSALKYDERQIRKQCVRCNQHLSGSLTAYRVGLVAILGEEVVAELDNNHEVKRYTRAELEGIEAHYKSKLRELRAKNNFDLSDEMACCTVTVSV